MNEAVSETAVWWLYKRQNFKQGKVKENMRGILKNSIGSFHRRIFDDAKNGEGLSK